MSGINKVIIIGRLGVDPDSKVISGGATMTRLSVATSESWTDKQGQKQERTEWHRIVVWNRLAEVCAKYLTKGRQVYVEGQLRTQSWEDQQGQKRYTTEIIGSAVRFLDSTSQNLSSQSGRPTETSDSTSQNLSSQSGRPTENSDSNNGSSPNPFNEFGPEPSFDSSEEIPF